MKDAIPASRWGRAVVLMALVFVVGLSGPAEADLVATLIDAADSTSLSGSAYYVPVSISVTIDPSITNWIAWHNTTTPTVVGGVAYVGSYTWIGVDDYFNLTIENPLGASATVRMDYNTGTAASSGPQAVIYGSAAAAPDVARWAPVGWWYSYTSANKCIFDEAGAFNSSSIFTTAGTYQFTFAWGNTGSYTAAHDTMYLLIDQAAVPLPSAVVLGALGLAFARWRLTGRRVD